MNKWQASHRAIYKGNTPLGISISLEKYLSKSSEVEVSLAFLISLPIPVCAKFYLVILYGESFFAHLIMVRGELLAWEPWIAIISSS